MVQLNEMLNNSMKILLGGNYRDKTKIISEFVFEMFKKHRQDRIAIHDDDIVKWAMEKKNEVYNCLLFFI